MLGFLTASQSSQCGYRNLFYIHLSPKNLYFLVNKKLRLDVFFVKVTLSTYFSLVEYKLGKVSDGSLAFEHLFLCHSTQTCTHRNSFTRLQISLCTLCGSHQAGAFCQREALSSKQWPFSTLCPLLHPHPPYILTHWQTPRPLISVHTPQAWKYTRCCMSVVYECEEKAW